MNQTSAATPDTMDRPLLGIALMLGCVGYLIKFTRALLFPEIDLPSFVGYPSTFGEIGICLWLLVMGIKDDQVDDKVLVRS